MTHARPTKVEVADGSGAVLATRRAQLLRAGEIATILWASGFRWLVAAAGLESCVSLGCRLVCATGLRECDHHVAMNLPLPQRLQRVGEPVRVSLNRLRERREAEPLVSHCPNAEVRSALPNRAPRLSPGKEYPGAATAVNRTIWGH